MGNAPLKYKDNPKLIQLVVRDLHYQLFYSRLYLNIKDFLEAKILYFRFWISKCYLNSLRLHLLYAHTLIILSLLKLLHIYLLALDHALSILKICSSKILLLNINLYNLLNNKKTNIFDYIKLLLMYILYLFYLY